MKRFANILLSIFFLLASPDFAFPAGDWNISTIDPDGSSASIAVDSLNNAHVAYSKHLDSYPFENSVHLYYAKNASGAWISEPVFEQGNVGGPALEIDSLGKAHISFKRSFEYYYDSHTHYGNYDLLYATNRSDEWEPQIADPALGDYDVSLLLDSEDKTYLIYTGFQGLMYATNHSGEWAYRIIHDVYSTNTGIRVRTNGDRSSAIDADGNIHVTYTITDSSHYTTLCHVSNESGDWVVTYLGEVGAVNVNNPSIALDSSGHVYIVYAEGVVGIPTSNIKYITDSSEEWSIATIAANIEGRGFYPSIILDSTDTIHVFYTNSYEELIHMEKRSSGWLAELIDNNCYSPSVKVTIDTTDQVHLLYYQREDDSCCGETALKYATKPIHQENEPVYRFFMPLTGAHFYTISRDEMNSIKANNPEYLFEGAGFFAFSFPHADSVPVYRFYNSLTGLHFYTASEDEKDWLIANVSEYSYEGVGFYAFMRQFPETLPVHRFYNQFRGVHFFTLNGDEKDYIINHYPEYRYEGIAFYAYPDPI